MLFVGVDIGGTFTDFALYDSETDEVAVYIDTFDAVEMADLPAGVEDPSYVDAWKAPAQ